MKTIYAQWYEAISHSGLSMKTIHRKAHDLRLFLAWCKQQHKKLSLITLADMTAYLQYMHTQKASYSTLRGVRRVLMELLTIAGKGIVSMRCMITLAKKDGYYAGSKERVVVRTLTADETELLAEVADALRLEGIRTVEEYIADIRAFLDWCSRGNGEYRYMTAQGIEAYQHTLVTQSPAITRGTINNKLNRVKYFYRYLFRKGIMSANPCEGVFGVPMGKTLPRSILSVEDMGRFLAVLPEKRPVEVMVKSVIYLLYGCALRISEVLTLHCGDCDSRGMLHIREGKNNGKRRSVPVPEMALRYLQYYSSFIRPQLVHDPAESLMYVYEGKEVRQMLVNRHIRKQAQLLGLHPITSHSMRHSAATHMLRNGAGIRDIQALLGHASIMTTAVYTRVVKDDLKRVIAACHPREAQEIQK